MRAKDLTSPFHGARRTVADVAAEEAAIAADEAPLARMRAMTARVRSSVLSYLQVMPPGAFVCGRSAAVLRDYPVPAGGELDIGTIAPQRSPKARGVRGRKIAGHLVQVEMLDGIPISSPSTTWAMLASELSVRQLIVLGDAIVRIPRDAFGVPHPERAGATLEELAEAAAAGRRVGVRKLNTALERIRVGSSSPLETDHRLDAEDAGLPDAQLDVDICDARGHRLGISEFAYPDFRVVVEVEGDHHRTSRSQWNRDIQKYRDYAAAGWEVVRLTNGDIRVRRTAVEIVRDALVRRGWRPSP